jgi:DNA-binding XRE family transcriptional regulator
MKKENQKFFVKFKTKKDKDKFTLKTDLLFFANEIYKARRSAKISQGVLAVKVDTTQKVISNIENADVNMGVGLAMRIARALNIQVKFGESVVVMGKNNNSEFSLVREINTFKSLSSPLSHNNLKYDFNKCESLDLSNRECAKIKNDKPAFTWNTNIQTYK